MITRKRFTNPASGKQAIMKEKIFENIFDLTFHIRHEHIYVTNNWLLYQSATRIFL